jgi:hypothetical protein
MTTKPNPTPALPAIVTEIQGIAAKLAEHAAHHPQLTARLTARKAYADSLPPNSAERAELEEKNLRDGASQTSMLNAHKSLTAELDSKKADMGQEVLELIKCVNADLHDLLESPSVRSDPEVMESTLNEAVTQLAEAANLYVYVREAQRGTLIPTLVAAAPVAPLEAPVAASAAAADLAPAPAADTPAVAAKPAAQAAGTRPLEEIPLELSEYCLHDRNGKHLTAFGLRYQRQLIELFQAQNYSIPAMTAFLKKRGLNGGALTTKHVDSLLRNGGIRMSPTGQARSPATLPPLPASPAKELTFRTRGGVDATGEHSKYGFKVKAGSIGYAKFNTSLSAHLQLLRAKLVQEKTAKIAGNQLIMCKDYVFTSTSAAAGFLTGYITSGPLAWQEVGTPARMRRGSAASEARAQA